MQEGWLLGEAQLDVDYVRQLEQVIRALETEKRLATRLLNDILPPLVVTDLLAGRSVPPQNFEDVTVFFFDVVGFTKFAKGMEPMQIANFLNELYTVIDLCAAVADVYKVETIGDAYMAVAGLASPSKRHTCCMADFSLFVREAVKIVRNPVRPDEPIELRFGLHSGPVVAGIVGHMMPRYFLFDDTVNTASRMETTGDANMIHCSAQVAETLAASKRYQVAKRGDVEVKGRGTMETYWLHSTTEDNPMCKPSVVQE
eukprot:TRINITY_DN8191_c0_g1_i2.p1 TRINITY_DN8191_c0_g1~~TRINITY_DN8191_c0_g1_i2.p1  ORF type:complete len:257 (-),score=43.91 TRINITY_DN8191_c0_g1_i2:535-1305(-)